jgi:alginate O-acetyltransferase complex protein AlgI
MLFSSSIFLFQFLPIVLAAYFGLDRRFHNVVLLLASLFFYAWGEKLIVCVLLLTCLVNYALGLWVDRERRRGKGKLVVGVAVAFNVGMLIAFKYADWLWGSTSNLLQTLGAIDHPLRALASFVPESSAWHDVLVMGGHIRLPIGISFFTFQALSYVVDVYRSEGAVQRNPINFALYKALFPQLIAGPIVRYRDVHDQITMRASSIPKFALGVRRFVLGLGKKMLIANVCARVADQIWGIPPNEVTPSLAWIAIFAYTLQIYFDFSGYSDMAIGLAHMFGFTFLENFRWPYVSRSITEFWRRWHISLSSWFRDYLYIPLGGSRVSRARTYFNLVLVFFLCGLWHGAAWNFVVWGLFHGAFLVIERAGLGAWLDRRPRFVQHVYVLAVVIVGWVFFRAPTLSAAMDYLGTMAGRSAGKPLLHHPALYVDSVALTAMIAGVIGSMPWLERVRGWRDRLVERGRAGAGLGLELAGTAALALVFVSSALELSGRSYNPFIYFRF